MRFKLNEKKLISAIFICSIIGVILSVVLFYISNYINSVSIQKINQTVGGIYIVSKSDDLKLFSKIPFKIRQNKFITGDTSGSVTGDKFGLQLMRQIVQALPSPLGRRLTDEEVNRLVTSTESYKKNINSDFNNINNIIINILGSKLETNKWWQNLLFVLLTISQILNALFVAILGYISMKKYNDKK